MNNIKRQKLHTEVSTPELHFSLSFVSNIYALLAELHYVTITVCITVKVVPFLKKVIQLNVSNYIL